MKSHRAQRLLLAQTNNLPGQRLRAASLRASAVLLSSLFALTACGGGANNSAQSADSAASTPIGSTPTTTARATTTTTVPVTTSSLIPVSTTAAPTTSTTTVSGVTTTTAPAVTTTVPAITTTTLAPTTTSVPAITTTTVRGTTTTTVLAVTTTSTAATTTTATVTTTTQRTGTTPQDASAALFAAQTCDTCHSANGLGTLVGPALTRQATIAELTTIIETRMPPADPTRCVGVCASDLASYIAASFTGKGSSVLVTDPLAGFATGTTQIDTVCARMAAANASNQVRTAFCGTARPTITSLTDLQSSLGIRFTNPTLVGRGNNGQGGNPGFALTGHSTSLVSRFVSAINPRAIIFTPPNARNPVPGFVTMGFTRGDQFAEITVSDRTTRALSYFLAAFTQACTATNSCTQGDLLTPAIERNWTSFTLYDESDLKNTILDCLQCHQTGGPGTQKILRMQELPNPWTHWFRDNRPGGIALFNDFRAAHGTTEDYAGIPAALLNSGDPARLEDVVRGNGFGNQPNLFNSPRIEAEVQASSAGQPANNNVPGTSATWNGIYQVSRAGNAIAVPYHDVKITDSAKLTAMTQAYAAFRAGNLAASDLPNIRQVALDSRAFEMGFAVDPTLDGRGVIVEACTQCHNSRLDQTISRSRFNVDLARMSDLAGGVLAGALRDQEMGTAIRRLNLALEDVKKMPPVRFFRSLTPSDITKAKQYLCTQVTTTIPECVP